MENPLDQETEIYRTHTNTDTYLYMYVYLHVCIYTYTYTYTYTCIYEESMWERAQLLGPGTALPGKRDRISKHGILVLHVPKRVPICVCTWKACILVVFVL